ncbi:MAG: DUF1294 domain-containing protein [Paracoccaceae bacterium]
MLAVNCLSLLIFGWDKGMARSGGWRVRESSMLLIAFFGGSAGAKVGQTVFRHKTFKEPFRTDLNRIILFQVFAGALLLAPPVRHFVQALAAFAIEIYQATAPQQSPSRFGPGS